MDKKRTLIVLGAGASACYENGNHRLPAQNDILKAFMYPKLSRSSPGIKMEGFVADEGLSYSSFLADYLCRKFGIKNDNENLLTEFWNKLSEIKLNLESLYDELEKDRTEEGVKATNDFIAILLSKIRHGVGSRSRQDVCKYHLNLVKKLDPSDYIITFNWDTLIDDALLYECPFWYPYTGYGVPVVGLGGEFFNKVHHIQSLLDLFHIHGSIGLYEPIEKKYKKGFFVVGPRGFCIAHEMFDLMGMTDEIKSMQEKGISGQPTPKRNITDDEQSLLDKGCIRVGEENKIWYQPIFVTPSKYKLEYKSMYVSNIRKRIHSRLPYTENIIIAGYSFPPADFVHLKSIFVPEIIQRDTSVMCINLENENNKYKEKVRQVFPQNNINFDVKDFKEFCMDLNLK